MTNTDTTTTHVLPVSRLEKSPLNARRTTAKVGMDELKASLLAHGLMQNLVVTDAGDGTFRVIAGGRRLEAIRSLQSEGRLPEDYTVSCQVVSEEHALEMSLAENAVRLAMHPADQFAAFAALIEKGESAEQVAQRFGIDENLVLKRMKLARVAPQLFEEYRKDALTLECLMAFTITDDHRRQVKVFKSLQNWQKDDPSAIRAVLTEKLVEAQSKLALFVGVDAYVAAGGTTRADLFGEEVYLEKPNLLYRLADKKLEDVRQELAAEGWEWIEVNPERDYDLINRCSRLRPQLVGAPAELIELKSQLDADLDRIEQALEDTESDGLLDEQQAIRDRLDDVERQLASFVGFDPEQKALAGCYVSLGHDGTLFFDKGLVKPEQRKQLARLLHTGRDDGTPVKTKPNDLLSESLRRDLAAVRQQVAQVEMAKHPAIAFDLLVFQVASSTLDIPSANDGLDVQFRTPRPAASSHAESSVATETLAAIARTLPAEWLKPTCEADRFAALRSLPQEAKLELLAYCVAMTLKPRLAPSDVAEATAYDAALASTEANVAVYWRPNKDNFLGRIGRTLLLDIRTDVLGEAWKQYADDKKVTLVEQLNRAFADPATHGRTPEQVERLTHWLPTGMAFDRLPAAKPTKAKKVKKAA